MGRHFFYVFFFHRRYSKKFQNIGSTQLRTVVQFVAYFPPLAGWSSSSTLTISNDMPIHDHNLGMPRCVHTHTHTHVLVLYQIDAIACICLAQYSIAQPEYGKYFELGVIVFMSRAGQHVQYFLLALHWLLIFPMLYI